LAKNQSIFFSKLFKAALICFSTELMETLISRAVSAWLSPSSLCRRKAWRIFAGISSTIAASRLVPCAVAQGGALVLAPPIEHQIVAGAVKKGRWVIDRRGRIER
jgi:hypothetical protein